MNIALVQLPHCFGEGLSREPMNYPLGLGYLSSCLQLKGIGHEGVNLWERQLTAEDAVQNVDFGRFDLIGISVYSTQYAYFKKL